MMSEIERMIMIRSVAYDLMNVPCVFDFLYEVVHMVHWGHV